jgi:glycosyltransferase involved in cell wall biosynthesis
MLKSIRAQTRRDMEVVVIDDGSTEPESVALLDRLGPDVRVLRKPNGGLSSARNAGLREARGEWVLPLDADDLVAPTLVERLMGAVERNPELDYVSPLVSYFEEEPAQVTGGWVPLGPDRDLLLVNNVGGAGAGSLIRRAAALEVGGYDEWMTSYEDWEFWCRVAAAGKRGTVVPEFLLYYRVRPDSMFRTEAVSRHSALHAYILARHAGMAADPSRVMRVLQSRAEADPEELARAIIGENVRYRMVDAINEALKRAGVQRALKGLTARVLRAGRRGRA